MDPGKSRRRTHSSPAPPDLTLDTGKNKRNWRRSRATGARSGDGRTKMPRRATMAYLAGEDEVTGSDAPGGSTDGGQRPPSADDDLSDSSDVQTAPEQSGDQGCDGAEHDGQQVISLEVPVPVDHLFKMMFKPSEMMTELYKKVKYYDVCIGDWKDHEDGTKTRDIRFKLDMTLKTATVTESQTLLAGCRPGSHYMVNSEVNNQGIPMSDVFYNTKHYCLRRVSGNACQLDAWCKTRFRKSTMFKSFVEKTANDGLEEHHNMLRRVLLDWTAGDGGAAKRRRKKRRAGSETDGGVTEAPEAGRAGSGGSSSGGTSSVSLLISRLTLLLTLVLLLLNGWLYLRLARLGSDTETLLKGSTVPAQLQWSPEQLRDWLGEAQRQQEQHRAELARYQQAVSSAAELVRQSETALHQLHESLEPVQTGATYP